LKEKATEIQMDRQLELGRTLVGCLSEDL